MSSFAGAPQRIKSCQLLANAFLVFLLTSTLLQDQGPALPQPLWQFRSWFSDLLLARAAGLLLILKQGVETIWPNSLWSAVALFFDLCGVRAAHDFDFSSVTPTPVLILRICIALHHGDGFRGHDSRAYLSPLACD